MRKQKQMTNKKEPQAICKVLGTWKNIKPAGITEPGSASELRTGDWRSQRPIHLKDKCINCMLCFIYCPDCSIKAKDNGEKFGEFDYYHCKGCGICAQVCPVFAIKMVDEGKAREEEKKNK